MLAGDPEAVYPYSSPEKFFSDRLNISAEMIALAQANHPQHSFIHSDICNWKSDENFDFILAWDSLFHLPFSMQKPVLKKLCQTLNHHGVLIYSFGDDYGEHSGQWHNDTFYCSAIGLRENCQFLFNMELSILHLELDQFPEKHAYIISQKR